MKSITANFKILDNTGHEFESSITINNPFTNNVMNEIKDRVSKVYNIKVEQILTIGNIVTT